MSPRDEIKAKSPVGKLVPVKVNDWDKVVYVKVISSAEAKVGESDIDYAIKSICDVDGKQIFTEDDREWLAGQPIMLLTNLVKIAVGFDSVSELKKS